MLQMTMKTMFTMLVVLPELAESCAFRFISEEDAIYATDLVKAFELSELVVRDDLKAVADSIIAKVNRGLGQAHGTGHGGVALNLMKRRIRIGKQLRKAQAKENGDVDEGTRKSGGDISHQDSVAKIATIAAASNSKASASTPSPISVAQLLPNAGPSIPLPGVLSLSIPGRFSVV